MMRQGHRVLFFTICAVLATSQIGIANPKADAALMNELTQTIAKVRTAESLAARTEAAEHLSHLTTRIKPKRVDDKTLADLESLLDTSEDPVRLWVAASLGNLGPRARGAAPKLLKILPEVDCLEVSLSSAPVIRVALKRMGVTPPPPNCASERKLGAPWRKFYSSSKPSEGQPKEKVL